jgi:hypothetical protein
MPLQRCIFHFPGENPMKRVRPLALWTLLVLATACVDDPPTAPRPDPDARTPFTPIVAPGTEMWITTNTEEQAKTETPPLVELGNVVGQIELMQATIGRIQARVQTCESAVCKIVQAHADIRMSEAGLARTAAEAGDWQAAAFHLTEVKQIVEGDIVLLEDVEDRGSVGDILALEYALLNQTEAALRAVAMQG